MYGVEYAIAKFRSQFVAVVMERHFARTLSGNSSPVTTYTETSVKCKMNKRARKCLTQATGPQELATVCVVSIKSSPKTGLTDVRTEEDVYAHKRDGRLLCRKIRCTSDSASDRYYELTDAHANCSHEQQITAAQRLHQVQAWESRCNINATVLLVSIKIPTCTTTRATNLVMTEMTKGSLKPAFSKYCVP